MPPSIQTVVAFKTRLLTEDSLALALLRPRLHLLSAFRTGS